MADFKTTGEAPLSPNPTPRPDALRLPAPRPRTTGPAKLGRTAFWLTRKPIRWISGLALVAVLVFVLVLLAIPRGHSASWKDGYNQGEDLFQTYAGNLCGGCTTESYPVPTDPGAASAICQSSHGLMLSGEDRGDWEAGCEAGFNAGDGGQ